MLIVGPEPELCSMASPNHFTSRESNGTPAYLLGTVGFMKKEYTIEI
jgi:hypothetical protein